MHGALSLTWILKKGVEKVRRGTIYRYSMYTIAIMFCFLLGMENKSAVYLYIGTGNYKKLILKSICTGVS